jgi:hypothetical protein
MSANCRIFCTLVAIFIGLCQWDSCSGGQGAEKQGLGLTYVWTNVSHGNTSEANSPPLPDFLTGQEHCRVNWCDFKTTGNGSRQLSIEHSSHYSSG